MTGGVSGQGRPKEATAGAGLDGQSGEGAPAHAMQWPRGANGARAARRGRMRRERSEGARGRDRGVRERGAVCATSRNGERQRSCCCVATRARSSSEQSTAGAGGRSRQSCAVVGARRGRGERVARGRGGRGPHPRLLRRGRRRGDPSGDGVTGVTGGVEVQRWGDMRGRAPIRSGSGERGRKRVGRGSEWGTWARVRWGWGLSRGQRGWAGRLVC